MGQNLTEGSNPSLSVKDPGAQVPGSYRKGLHVVYRLTNIAVWPVVRIAFVVNGAIGLFFGSLYGFLLFVVGLVIDTVGGDQLPFDPGIITGVFGFVFAILSGMMYGVFGAVFAAIAAWLYNVMADLVGPVELTLEPEEVEAALPDLSEPEPVPVTTHGLPTLDESAPIPDTEPESPDEPSANQPQQ